MEQENEFLEAFALLGTNGVAKACELSYHAVYKWLQKGRLPRTEYTGETDYAKKIAQACLDKDPATSITAERLLLSRNASRAVAA